MNNPERVTEADAQVTFSFKQVEAMLAELFRVPNAKRPTLVGRLQQLQKLSLPLGTNVGRGKRVTYETWQLAELALYLDLLDVGITPAALSAHFGQSPFYPTLKMCNEAHALEYAKPAIVAVIYFAALDGLRTTENKGAHQILLTPRPEDVIIAITENSGVVVNLSVRLRMLKQAASAVLKDQSFISIFSAPDDLESRGYLVAGESTLISVGER